MPDADDYSDRPPWRRPVLYNDPELPETPHRDPSVEDDEPRVVEEFGLDDDDYDDLMYDDERR
jgi:hypothetical protein